LCSTALLYIRRCTQLRTSANMPVMDGRHAPTPEEFEAARQREIARLNMRVYDIKGKSHHTPVDSKLLKGDTWDKRVADMEIVRRWCESKLRGVAS